ncbi:MAG: potassium channel family protein [Planctomycetota bacterium]|jgi:trk system potassium uptake protein TrkA
MYIIIGGGGMVGGTLARKLIDNKHDVVLIEPDKNVCDSLYAKMGVVAISGNATDLDVLKDAGVDKCDIYVAATGSDTNNLASTILAKSQGVSQVLVRMRNPEYESAYKVAGVDTTFRVTDILVDGMLMEIEKPEVRKFTTIGSGGADIYVIVVPKGAKVSGMSVKEITANSRFPSPCTFIAVYNKEKEAFSIPRGDQLINEEDHLYLISNAEHIKQAADFLTAAKSS